MSQGKAGLPAAQDMKRNHPELKEEGLIYAKALRREGLVSRAGVAGTGGPRPS